MFICDRENISRYKDLYGNIYERDWNECSSFYDHTRNQEDYWSIDHETMKYFETIEEIPKPKDWDDLNRLEEGFLYHSQYRQYNRQCYELVRTKLGEQLDELFFILSRTNGKDNACKERNFNDALSQGIRYK